MMTSALASMSFCCGGDMGVVSRSTPFTSRGRPQSIALAACLRYRRPGFSLSPRVKRRSTRPRRGKPRSPGAVGPCGDASKKIAARARRLGGPRPTAESPPAVLRDRRQGSRRLAPTFAPGRQPRGGARPRRGNIGIRGNWPDDAPLRPRPETAEQLKRVFQAVRPGGRFHPRAEMPFKSRRPVSNSQ